MKDTDIRIRKFVGRIRGRLREQSILESLCSFGAVGLFAALAVFAVSLAVPFFYAGLLAAGILAVSFAAGLVRGIRGTPSLMEAAIKADALGYREKISTALFLEGKSDIFSSLLKREVVQIADGFSVQREFPLHLPRKRLAPVVLLALLSAAVGQMETPARQAAQVRHNVKKEAKEEIAQLEKLEKEITGHNEISGAEKAEVREQIENAKRELAQSQSGEELKKSSERFAKKMEQKSAQTENETLGEALDRAAKESGKRADARLAELSAAAGEAMEQAKNGSRGDKRKAARELEALADYLGEEALKQTAENYRDSQFSDAGYEAAKGALNQALEQHPSGDYAQQSSGRNQKGKADRQMSGEAAQAGSREKDSAREQNGTGSQGQNSGGKGGNGSGVGKGSGSSGSGSGGGWNFGSKDGREGAAKTGENITVPEGELGDDGNLTGKAGDNGTGTKAASNSADAWSGNKVSYEQVSGEYKEKAYKKINGSRYPGKLKDRIRNYFDGLNSCPVRDSYTEY